VLHHHWAPGSDRSLQFWHIRHRLSTHSAHWCLYRQSAAGVNTLITGCNVTLGLTIGMTPVWLRCLVPISILRLKCCSIFEWRRYIYLK
jgi:hypothetical protein